MKINMQIYSPFDGKVCIYMSLQVNDSSFIEGICNMRLFYDRKYVVMVE